MNKLVAVIVFLVVTGGMYLLCRNAHIDFFPCAISSRDMNRGMPGFEPPLVTRKGTCSLMAHNRKAYPDGTKARLTGAGWAMLLTFCAGIGLVAGGVAGVATRNRG